MKRRSLLILQLSDHEDQNSLPFKKVPHVESPGGEKSLARPGGAIKKQVAIVDDDPLVRNMFQKILGMNGIDVVAAVSDGSEIVELVDSVKPRPGIVILDERMPKMSGVEACKIIHSKYPDIAIIFVSADQTAEERALAAGAKAFLRKPVSTTKLLALVNSL